MEKNRFITVRNASTAICEPLAHEDHVVQPAMFVSPPKWHLAHTTWFFEQFVLIPNKKGYKVYNDSYNYLFNSYYESIGARVLRTDRGNMTRPGILEILQYRKYVDEAMLDFLSAEQSPKINELIELGLNHEQQHQELLFTDIKYILGHNPLFPVYKESSTSNKRASPRKMNYVEVPEGIYEIGYTGEGFCFDNEKGAHKVFLHAFRYMDRLATNEEYIQFMEQGGYSNALLWLGEGWDWVKQNGITAPMYWYRMDNEWYNYTLNGLRKVDPNEPVTHISFYEADAFARWKGQRLMTEFEWEAACRKVFQDVPHDANFTDKGKLHPVLANGHQMLGDAWEWTNSAYLPYPYYKQEKGALGEYNGKFMVNQMVLRGGSCVTPRDHIRMTYRNFFHADERWQFTGIRLAESL
jgi:ergothioneine biosynthesis protein EgtB